MTATAVCSATAEPPTVLVCINKLATTHGAVAKSKAFCVNVLRAEDWELSTTFSGAQSGESRFKSRDWTRLATGSPVLIDALVSFDCRVVKKMAHGTHTIFLGEVEQVLFGQKGKPLLYSEGQYAKLASLTLGEPLPEGLDYWGFWSEGSFLKSVVLAANFVTIAARMSLVTFLGIYFVREAGIDLATVGLAFLCENLLRGVAAPFFGALSDRIGRRPLLLGAALVTAAVLPCFLLVRGTGVAFRLEHRHRPRQRGEDAGGRGAPARPRAARAPAIGARAQLHGDQRRLHAGGEPRGLPRGAELRATGR